VWPSHKLASGFIIWVCPNLALINGLYGIRCFRQENHQTHGAYIQKKVYGHVQCKDTVVANPTHVCVCVHVCVCECMCVAVSTTQGTATVVAATTSYVTIYAWLETTVPFLACACSKLAQMRRGVCVCVEAAFASGQPDKILNIVDPDEVSALTLRDVCCCSTHTVVLITFTHTAHTYIHTHIHSHTRHTTQERQIHSQR
jgi:hypothetical protein